MKSIKVVTVVGARPQFIKAAVVSRAIKKSKSITESIIHTGQHYDKGLSEVFFKELEILKPDYNLEVGSGSHGYQTARMLEKLECLLVDSKPDWVLVYGDTNSTLAGALAAVKLHIPVAHVEAGLRSFNRKMPEEINRVLTDHVSDLLLVPTETAYKNLVAEGMPEKKLHLVGDVMLDAALYYAQKAEDISSVLQKNNLIPGQYILSTIHRAENTDDRQKLKTIIDGFVEVSRELPVVLPLHPRTKDRLKNTNLLELANKNLLIIEPLGYLDMVMVEKNAALIATDSGGVQKEAFFYKVPCVTLREETEWLELLESNWNILCPPRSSFEVSRCILSRISQNGDNVKLYGDGNSAERIADKLQSSMID